jgi:hypothetical protein
MSDLTPPPERPLDEQTRHQMRAELIATTGQPISRTSRGWLVPTAAAAAVAAVIGGGALLLNNSGGQQLAPSGNDTSAATTPSTPTTATTGTPTPAAVVPDPACASAVKEFLPGADMQYSQLADPAGKVVTDVEVWVDGNQWQVCDTFATLDDPAGQRTPTLFAVHSGRTVPDQEQVRISMNFVQLGGGLHAEYVAAGRVSPAVTKISYAFPDGHVEAASPADDGYWSIAYLPEGGPLAGGDLRNVDPIEVTVTADGAQQNYTLEWGVDTCAQINHGC